MRALPTLLTGSRLAAAPVLAALLLWAEHVSFTVAAGAAAPLLWGAFVLFALAAATDAVDGPLARHFGVVSALGAALDHAADKTLVAAGLIAYAITWAPFDLIVAGLIIVLRDLAMAGLREGLSLSGRALPVAGLGKAKTVLEMVGLGAALLQLALSASLDGAGVTGVQALGLVEALATFGLWAAAALALITLGLYVHAAVRRSAAAPES